MRWQRRVMPGAEGIGCAASWAALGLVLASAAVIDFMQRQARPGPARSRARS